MGRAAKTDGTGKPASKRLTAEQRLLVEQNTGLAYDVVYNFGKRSIAIRAAVENLGTDRAVSEALFGLVKAASGDYDSRRCKFSTYAVAAIIRAVVEAGKTCGRLTERRRDKADHVPFMMQFASLQNERTTLDLIPEADRERPYSADELEVLRKAIGRLPEKERTVLMRRFFIGDRLHDISPDIGVSREMVRQIEAKALHSLRRMLRLEDGCVRLDAPEDSDRLAKLQVARLLMGAPKGYRYLLSNCGLSPIVMVKALQCEVWFHREKDKDRCARGWLYFLTEHGRKECTQEVA